MLALRHEAAPACGEKSLSVDHRPNPPLAFAIAAVLHPRLTAWSSVRTTIAGTFTPARSSSRSRRRAVISAVPSRQHASRSP